MITKWYEYVFAVFFTLAVTTILTICVGYLFAYGMLLAVR